MIRVLLVFGCAVLQIITLTACAPTRQPEHVNPIIQSGFLYTVDDGEGWFRFAKVLVVDDQAVHIRLYKNRFRERPTTVDPATLVLGNIQDADGFGIGHLPLTQKAFAAWKPVFLERGVVKPDELEGYETWKDAGGKLFGN